ncbi:MAG TPA: hypothetical protein VEA59_01445 [Patescibacteria group bacterium]|nr:hypothetical protein [Patescibacteria group bacterium]
MKSPSILPHSNQAGITYFEVIMVIALLTAITSLTLIIGTSSFRGYQFRTSREVLRSVLVTARQNSLSNIAESKHGVRLEANQITLFRFPYTTGTSTNQVFAFEGGVRLAGITFPYDVVFTQLSADTTAVNFTITNDHGKTGTISISSEGAISW